MAHGQLWGVGRGSPFAQIAPNKNNKYNNNKWVPKVPKSAPKKKVGGGLTCDAERYFPQNRV